MFNVPALKDWLYLEFIAHIGFFTPIFFRWLLDIFIPSADFNVSLLCTGTSLVMTVIRSFGNDHGHLGAWCWTQTGRTGKASLISFWL